MVTTTPDPPTAQEIEDALAGLRGPIVESFAYEWRSLNYVLLGDFELVFPGGSIEMDTTRPIVRTGSIEFNKSGIPDGFDINNDHIAITHQMLIEGEQVRFPRGLFHIDIPDELLDESATDTAEIFVNGVLSDVGVHLNATISEPLTIAAGTNYIEAIRTILDQLGLSHNLPNVTDTLPVLAPFGPGTSLRKIVDEMTKGINYYPIWPNGRGVFLTREQIDPALEPVDVEYTTDTEPRLIEPPFVRSRNTAQLPNRAIVVQDHPDRTPGFEIRENNDGVSPASTQNAAGVFTAGPISGALVVDNTREGDLATFVVQEGASRAEPGTLNTFPDPRREVHETYQLTIEGVEATSLWRQLGWSQTLDVGQQMQHRVGRARSISIIEPSGV